MENFYLLRNKGHKQKKRRADLIYYCFLYRQVVGEIFTVDIVRVYVCV